MKTLRFFGYLNFHIQISWYPLASKLSPSNIIQRFRKTCSLTVHHVSNVILLEEHPLFWSFLHPFKFHNGLEIPFLAVKIQLLIGTHNSHYLCFCPVSNPRVGRTPGCPPVSSWFTFNCFTINHMCCKCLF